MHSFEGEEGYLRLLDEVITFGKIRGDRTGTGTHSLFSAALSFNLQDGFPLLTTKKMAWKSIVGELLWFLSGSSELGDLRKFTYGSTDNRKTIWDADIERWWAEAGTTGTNGGRLYGPQWRDFGDQRCDQVVGLLEEAKTNPESRRLLINAWNASDIDNDWLALPPCHFAVQFYIEDGKLNCKWNQRSVDCFLGLPFNIASYALLTHIFAQWLDLEVGYLVGDLTNVHVYQTHIDAVREQLKNEPLTLCEVNIPKVTLEQIEDFEVWAKDFTLDGYESHQQIKAPMAY